MSSNHSKKHQNSKVLCDVCKKMVLPLEIFSGHAIRESLLPFVQHYASEWTLDNSICLSCLNKVRSDYVEQSLLTEKGELTEAEIEVLDSLRKQEPISTHPDEVEEGFGWGARLSDKIAAIGGSWSFIISFFIVLLAWVLANSIWLGSKAFDPYPYILLNLFLSSLAAFQAPIIMMSQNRQSEKDRLKAEEDYKTNLKAELEIRHLHIKIDQLISHQWHKLLEIQQVQLDMLKDVSQKDEA